MKTINKIAWIEIKDRKILSAKSFAKDKFYIPGGKPELHESDHETLCREILEELDIKIDQKTISYFGTFEAQADGHPTGIMVKMTCYTANYSGEIKASSEIERVEWLDSKDVAKISAVDKLIFSTLKNKNLIE